MSSIDNNLINTKDSTNAVKDSTINDPIVQKIVKKRGRRPKNKSNIISPLDKTGPVIATVPKKRGRKPKIKDPNEIDKLPKKRGRKPKIKDPNEPVNIPKKRGRKPKQQSYGVGNPISNVTETGPENIILHLPIKSDKILNNNTDFQDKQLLKYDPEIYIPIGNETIGLESNKFSWIDQSKTKTYNLLDKPIHPDQYYPYESLQKNNKAVESDKLTNHLTNAVSDEIKDTVKVADTDNYFTNNEIELEYSKKSGQEEILDEDKCDKMLSDIKQQRKLDISNKSTGKHIKSIDNTMKQFLECNYRDDWPTSTVIYCYWCCHQFNNTPCALPIRYNNKRFIVYGCYCSPECAAAYNFNDLQAGEEIWERYSLLNLLYKRIYDNSEHLIKLAPPRQVLSCFGGNLSIEEFRNVNKNYNKTYNIVMPPMISIIPQQEEMNINKGTSNKKTKTFIPMDKDQEIDVDNFRLKRSYPINDKNNTLESCMQLEYK